MGINITPIEVESQVIAFSKTTIVSFPEPAIETIQKSIPGSRPPVEQELNGTELFSMFTADIIKQRVLFIR